jgi:hypothetical protein
VKICLGLKTHSGWSALVAIGALEGEFCVVDRRRIELIAPEDLSWARQPYHAAEGLSQDSARDVVTRGIETARQGAARELRAAVERSRESGHDIAACAVLVPQPLPTWSVDQILAVHVRMHQAEGALFPDAIARAADSCGLPLVAIPEKQLGERAEKALAAPLSRLVGEVAALGKSVGAPWGKDQKSAALAAMVALKECSK